jgi:hypothetical protein
MKKYLYPADILLPYFSNDPEKMQKWACIACDQYTSEPEYWREAEELVKDAPSALRVILPELFLDEADNRIGKINSTMGSYLENILVNHESSMIYLERQLKNGKIRRGIIGAVDLEDYDYNKGAQSLIRATEGTVLDRIPPRVKIREGAVIELPHIMILIDDPERTVIEPLSEAAGLETAYDFDLMMSGGHVKGSFIPKSEQERISAALCSLCDPKAFSARYMLDGAPLLFAMGDGNHSLAAAKAYWEQLKPGLSESERQNHPARYALCEIVNIHDEALEFEPIYRVVFGVDPKKLVTELKEYASSLPESNIESQKIKYITACETGEVVFDNPTSFLPVGTLQTFLDRYIKENPGVKIDYIHGESSTEKLASGEEAIGFIFRGMEKGDLFKTVICDGALPRKTFSMGEADDKRFYLEARKIK